jgi:hypothetical protein
VQEESEKKIMASIKPGPLVTKIRGSVGGVCFGAGPGGDTARRKSKPKWPWSEDQREMQCALAAAAAAWRLLTPAVQTAWREYAETVDLTNRLGDTFHPTGANMFIRRNVFVRLQGISWELAERPTDDGLPLTYVPTLAYSGGDLVITEFFPVSTGLEQFLATVYAATSQRGSVRGSYRGRVSFDGAGPFPLTLLADVNGYYPVTSNLRVWVSLRMMDYYERVSNEMRYSLDFTAA